ncbi:nicotinate (nicotinamide) nucleotide adenylyltransferase [Mycoplasmoides fastidiosum]|uniref:Probable nicotinate-nucleotide adenylyltransferase n=1 Tax=Mycoplasmoides fastidiosum TaxID=92758 RepID=A0ABU0LZV2_9BACT|nr:nicotinate (nicotinamide) nucleotide adenylyltransferase [Mycoplasmoides fastidiosum]MDQ0514235.1 nicotinate (nicotinamide) nucleotide adenylyltransferase [Mycoplasmoides fastidiosum]UUD37358.1 nicotinate (nicotinamide) nucleotide adenylyltransferase [Mycoplasmoides fastidiosum]
MKIGIFGGSFNPIHKGHVKIARNAIKVLGLDLLYFVPAYRNPDKINHNYVLGYDRMQMIDLVKPDKSVISTWELSQAKLSYTFETINHFKNHYPNDQLFFILGSDNLDHLDQWEGIDQILAQCQIVCFKRNKRINWTNLHKLGVQLIDQKLFPESSTAFRAGQFDYLAVKVKRYIGNNYLYLFELLTTHLKQNPELKPLFDFTIQILKSFLHNHQLKVDFLLFNENHARIQELWTKTKINLTAFKQIQFDEVQLLTLIQTHRLFIDLLPVINLVTFIALKPKDFVRKKFGNNLVKIFEWGQKYSLNKTILMIFGPTQKTKVQKNWTLIYQLLFEPIFSFYQNEFKKHTN